MLRCSCPYPINLGEPRSPFGHEGERPSARAHPHPSCLHRAPSTTPSGSTGTWKRTACAASTEQRAETATWCCVAGKVGPPHPPAETRARCGLERGMLLRARLAAVCRLGCRSPLWVCGRSMTGPCFPGCTCTFKDHCKLREHLRSHTQEKVVACPTCGGMFANNTKFLDHIRRQTSLDRKSEGRGAGCSFGGWGHVPREAP